MQKTLLRARPLEHRLHTSGWGGTPTWEGAPSRRFFDCIVCITVLTSLGVFHAPNACPGLLGRVDQHP